MKHLKQETVSGAQLNMDALYQICPQCFTESKDSKTGEIHRSVDFDKLRLLLGDNIAQGDERYEFTWVGKRAALQEAAKPIRKTLRPCPEESVDWENTKNLYIEGDNLEVLKLLLNSYMGKVKLLYFDPPYNTGNDFVYHDDFHLSKDEYDFFAGDVNEEGDRLIKNTESNGRFHSDWCSMIYSRLMIARSLLNSKGVIAISINYCELYNLMKICQELFNGSQVFAVTVQTSGGKPNGAFSISNEYIVFVVPQDFNPIPTEEDMKEYASPYHGMNLATFNQVERPNQAYPIYINNKGGIVGCGKSIQERINDGSYSGEVGDFVYDYNEAPTGCVAIWPVTAKGDQCVWRLIPSRLMNDWKKGYIKVVPQKEGKTKNVYSVQYLSGGIIDKIKSGEIKTYRLSDDADIPTLEVEEYKTAGSGIASIWSDSSFYTTRGSNDIRELFNGKVFSYPKPLPLITYLLKRLTSNDDLIVDVFSGSSTTAHATMMLNAKDSGNRKYIMIQWPEETPLDSEASKSGYKNICEIGKERIRRAGKKILEEQKAKQGDLFSSEKRKLDVGFRVFKCADSNMKDVYYAPSEYDQQMLFDLEDNIKDDRNDLDLLFGCMLDWGVTLDLPLRTEKVDGINIHIVNEGDLVACFEKHIPESVIDHIASLLPMRVVLRDSCFNEAKEKMNFFEIFKQRTGWSEEEVRKNIKVI